MRLQNGLHSPKFLFPSSFSLAANLVSVADILAGSSSVGLVICSLFDFSVAIRAYSSFLPFITVIIFPCPFLFLLPCGYRSRLWASHSTVAQSRAALSQHTHSFDSRHPVLI